VNEAQNNPLQPDVQYRGFVGSPLLGLPQGIAVYQDGVRLNEPFGDTVNWALIPESAIDTVYLMPGSNPLFGLNALGGAISVQTKDGFTNPGTSGEIFGGSFGRIGVQASVGGSSDGFGYFVTGAWLDEDGWRDFSPTESAQLFGKLGWQRDRTDIDLSLALTETDLIGNGPAPAQLLGIDREAIFTRPDISENSLRLANLSAEHRLSSSWTLTGNVYVRSSDIDTLNGDDSDFEECEDTPGFICEEEDGEEEIVLDENDMPIPASEDLEGATVNRTGTRQDGRGFGFQASSSATLGGRDNLLVVGLVVDDGEIDFAASTELGALDATRLAVPGGVFVGESFTELEADVGNVGAYVSNTFSLSDTIALTVSGRYNQTDVVLRDQLGTALNGDHSFERFNPAIGVTAELSEALTVYAGYTEANRAPSPVELTCADEDDPCRLPNAFLADPPLEQVVAETIETGLRGASAMLSWHVGAFRTTSCDDILFISAGALTNEGFFDNVGTTRRDGFEANLDGLAAGGLGWRLNYTYLDATFRESLSFPSPNNPLAIDGEVAVRPGDRLPLVPEHLLKLGISKPFGEDFSVAADLIASSGSHMRGDEGNDVTKIGGYAVVNVRGSYRVNQRLRVFVAIDNLFDRDYETFGLFGEPDEVLGDAFDDSRFFSPAAPRAAWAGIEFEL
ncbi:MAG: TonB-dependent receptor, partial [Gammaproteobacteria bacterium]|nr:TonB-dependent receptor [Gammaproteobacteria bacterium]